MPNPFKVIGGLGQAAKLMLKPADEAAEYLSGVHYADPIKPATMRMSEALGNVGAEGKTLRFTEADRSRVAGESRGGVGFSGLQHYSEPHKKANTVWGFGNKDTANKKINQNDPENTVWTTYVGSPTQHKSNLVVLNKSLDKFHEAVAGNKVHPEQIRLMNARLQSRTSDKTRKPLFNEALDLTDQNVMTQLNTFEKRSAAADVLMGLGVKKPMHSKVFKEEFGPQPWGDAGKMGSILRRETDPDLLDANTFDVGNRLFTMDNGVTRRADLNAAFPYQVTGDDLGLKYRMTPRDVAMRDWIKQYEGRLDKHGKPSPIGTKDVSAGQPSQLVDEDYLTHLQKAGFKEGGSVDIEAADKRLEAAMGQRMAGGGKAGVYKGFKRLFADPDAMTPQERVANFPLDSYDVDPKKLLLRDRYGKEMGEAVEGYGIGGIIKGAAKRAKGFYSAVDNAAAGLKRPMGTGVEFMAEIKATPGVKLAEIKSRNLTELQALPKMPKAQFIKELEARPPVKIEEKVLSNPSQKDVDALADKLAYQRGVDEAQEFSKYGDDLDDLTESGYELALKHDWDELQATARETLKEAKGGPFHELYTLPGGENYREILLKNPAAKGEGYPGKAEHFGGERNILASIRVSDRSAPSYTKQQATDIGQRIADSMNVADAKNLGNGALAPAIKSGAITPLEAAQYADYRGFKNVDTTGARTKILHVEEIQSDLHQQARDLRGNEIKRLMNKGMSHEEAVAAVPDSFAYGQLGGDAPFKKDWQELAMRKVMQEAVDGGYDKVVLTKGADQAERYSLSSQVSRLEWKTAGDESTRLIAYDRNGNNVYSGPMSPRGLSEYVGDDVANKLMNSPVAHQTERGDDVRQLSGLDINAGAQGMEGFYDKMLPDYMNKLGKPYGVKVEPHNLSMADDAVVPVHSFDVSPQMRQDITDKGLPLYQQVGIPTGAVGAELMNQPEDGMAEGGAAFKTLQWRNPQHFDGGGIASPEDASIYSGTPSVGGNIRANATEMYESAKQELARLKNPETAKQFAKITGAQLVGGLPDLAHLAIEYGVDPILRNTFTQLDPLKGATARRPMFGSISKALKTEDGLPIGGSEHMLDTAQKAGLMYGKTVYTRNDDGSFKLDEDTGEKVKLYQTGRFNPLLEIAGSILGGSAASKLGKGAVKGVGNLLKSDKLAAVQPEVKTAMTGTPQGSYATRQNGPFYEVSPASANVNRPAGGGSRKADELQGQAPVGGSAGQAGRQVPSRLSDEAVAGVVADPASNKPLQIARRYTKETQGADFAVPNIPESSLVKQSAIGRAHQLAVEGSPEYKSAVFDAYSREMPQMLEQSGAKSYDDLMAKAYRQLAKETDDQFKQLPYNFSYHRAGEGNYANSTEMLADVHGNQHLYVFQGGDPHDFLNRMDKATGLNENEKFRAVHDLIGHGVYGNSFGPNGEEMAYAVHQQMYSPLARLAMAAETRGQNSLVNYSPLNAEFKANAAKLDDMLVEAKRRGDTALVNEIQAINRQEYANSFKFAPQKAVLLPPEMLDPRYAGGMPDYLSAANRFDKSIATESALTHFSNSPGLQSIDPTRYGTGIKGAEAGRLRDFPGGVKDRSYFYMGEPGMVAPESGLGVKRYRGESKGLYDIADDPLLFRSLAREANRTPYSARVNAGVTSPLQEANDFERMVKEYGYEGMANPKSSKPMAIMFKPTQVEARKRGGLAQLKTR